MFYTTVAKPPLFLYKSGLILDFFSNFVRNETENDIGKINSILQDATLFVYFSYFITYKNSFNHNTFIRRHSLKPLSISSSLVCSVGKTSLWCRAKNRTWACLTDALPTEPRRTIAEPRRTMLSHAAPLLSHAAPY
jgi:hypothetical protein